MMIFSSSAATRRQVVAMGASLWYPSSAMRSAATRRQVVAMGASLWYPASAMRSAATRRQVVAMGASLWYRDGKLCLSPDGTTRGGTARIHFAPFGACRCRDPDHGLTPVATTYRPIGTKSQKLGMLRNPASAMRSAATRRQVVAMGASLWYPSSAMRSAATRRQVVAMGASLWYPSSAMRSAATRRQVVAMGASLWYRDGKLCLSPDGTTRGGAARIHFAPFGACRCRDADHGLTPVATAYRPVGTKSQKLGMLRNLSSAWRLAATRRQVVAMGASLWFLKELGYGA